MVNFKENFLKLLPNLLLMVAIFGIFVVSAYLLKVFYFKDELQNRNKVIISKNIYYPQLSGQAKYSNDSSAIIKDEISLPLNDYPSRKFKEDSTNLLISNENIILINEEPYYIDKEETGIASIYSKKYHNKKTASGEPYNHYDFVAAHRTLPFGTYVKVINLKTQESVIVRIVDRGPFVKKRIIDLSKAASDVISNSGLLFVKIQVLKKIKDKKYYEKD